MAKLKSRVNIAAVILSFADKPLHSNSDLSYMAEVIRAGEDKDPGTPWATMYSNITTKGWFTLETGSCFSLNVPDGMSKKDFAVEKVTQPVYDAICEELRKCGFLTADNKLRWMPHSNYVYDGVNPGPVSPQKASVPLIDRIDKLLKNSYQVILTGAPGTGKTFTAKQLAQKWISETNGSLAENFCQVQFHPGYDYSDFIIGLKPELVKGKVTFKWKDGLFKAFADKAKKVRETDGENSKPYIFLIDEINRADLSRVFGEVFSLLEEDYRYPKNETGIILPDGSFFILPDNLYIIATMNDIDRSVESMDFALRRRFSFLEVKAEDSVCIIEENTKISDGNKAKLKNVMAELNKYIGSKNELLDNRYHLDLGDEYALGGAYFVHFAKYQALPDSWSKLWNNHIAVILNEYLRGHRDRHAVLTGLKNVFETACSGGNENA